MSVNHDLERRITDHYAAEAPPRAPDWVLERILAVVDTTPQRRTVFGPPWWIPSMPSTSVKLGATAIAIASIGLVGLTFLRQPAAGPGGSMSPVTPPASLSPQHSPGLGEATFNSTIHGVAIDHPAGWQVRQATEPWNHGAVVFGAPDVDVIYHPTLQDALYFALVSEPLGGLSRSEWVGAISLSSVGICTEPSSGGSGGIYAVDGADGYATSCGSDAAGGYVVTVATDTRGYIIYLHVGNEPLLQATFDEAWFEAALETVDLRPEEALDAPRPSKSP